MTSPQGSVPTQAFVKWLHLSDWHEGRPDFDRTLVLDALVADIERRDNLGPGLKDLDFVFFTGDLAFSGKPEQYLKVRLEFVERVVNAAGVKRERVFFVPGNHDVDRDKLELLPSLLQTFKTRQALTRWLTSETHRRALLEPMRAFREFTTEFYRETKGYENLDATYGYMKRVQVGPTSVDVIGLNSAWMCGQRVDGGEVNDYGYLILGEPQFNPYMPTATSHVDLRIALMHHLFWWFSFLEPRARGKARLLKNCDFILRGHEHEASVEVPSGQTGRCSIISAGAAYDRLDFPNGYNFVQLDMSQRQGTIYLRRFEQSATVFMPDISITPRVSPGYLSFSLPDEDADEGPSPARTSQRLSGEPARERPEAHTTSRFATNKLSGDQWSLQNVLTMEKLGEVYRIQHEGQRFRQQFCSFFVRANCLLPETDPAYGEPDVIRSVKEIQALKHPIYCLLMTLTISAVEDFAGDADWTVQFVDGRSVDTIAVPVTDTKATGTRELLLFFDPVPQPGDPAVKVDFHWRVHNSVRPLKLSRDELFINPTRAEGPIGRMDLVLQVPIDFGDVSMVPSSRPRASREGQLMTGDELAEYKPPTGFKTMGWTGRNLAPEKLFGVDLIPNRLPAA